MDLLIGIPCLDTICTDFVRCLLALTDRLRRDDVKYEIKLEQGSLVYLARDRIADYASKNCIPRVLWLDSDMVFKDDIYQKLRSTGAEIATGLCRNRHGKFGYPIYSDAHTRITEIPNKPFPVFMCGAAALLTSTTVLEHIAEKNNAHPFCPTKDFGEDLQFCIRANAMGYKIICHPDVKVGHIFRAEVWPDTDVTMLKKVLSREGT